MNDSNGSSGADDSDLPSPRVQSSPSPPAPAAAPPVAATAEAPAAAAATAAASRTTRARVSAEPSAKGASAAAAAATPPSKAKPKKSKAGTAAAKPHAAEAAEEEAEEEEEEAGNNDEAPAAADKARAFKEDPQCETCPQRDLDEIIIGCKMCGCLSHPSCYGVPVDELPGGGYKGCRIPPWTCVPCRDGVPVEQRPCYLCRLYGGPMKPMRERKGQYGHVSCGLFCEELWFEPEDGRMRTIDGLAYVPKHKRDALCAVCGKKAGCCFQCNGQTKSKSKAGKQRTTRCKTLFHVECARRAGEQGYSAQMYTATDPDNPRDYLVASYLFCPAHSNFVFDEKAYIAEQKRVAAVASDPAYWDTLKKQAAGEKVPTSKKSKKASSTKGKGSKRPRDEPQPSDEEGVNKAVKASTPTPLPASSKENKHDENAAPGKSEGKGKSKSKLKTTTPPGMSTAAAAATANVAAAQSTPAAAAAAAAPLRPVAPQQQQQQQQHQQQPQRFVPMEDDGDIKEPDLVPARSSVTPIATEAATHQTPPSKRSKPNPSTTVSAALAPFTSLPERDTENEPRELVLQQYKQMMTAAASVQGARPPSGEAAMASIAAPIQSTAAAADSSKLMSLEGSPDLSAAAPLVGSLTRSPLMALHMRPPPLVPGATATSSSGDILAYVAYRELSPRVLSWSRTQSPSPVATGSPAMTAATGTASAAASLTASPEQAPLGPAALLSRRRHSESFVTHSPEQPFASTLPPPHFDAMDDTPLMAQGASAAAEAEEIDKENPGGGGGGGGGGHSASRLSATPSWMQSAGNTPSMLNPADVRGYLASTPPQRQAGNDGAAVAAAVSSPALKLPPPPLDTVRIAAQSPAPTESEAALLLSPTADAAAQQAQIRKGPSPLPPL